MDEEIRKAELLDELDKFCKSWNVVITVERDLNCISIHSTDGQAFIDPILVQEIG